MTGRECQRLAMLKARYPEDFDTDKSIHAEA